MDDVNADKTSGIVFLFRFGTEPKLRQRWRERVKSGEIERSTVLIGDDQTEECAGAVERGRSKP